MKKHIFTQQEPHKHTSAQITLRKVYLKLYQMTQPRYSLRTRRKPMQPTQLSLQKDMCLEAS